MTVNFSDLDQRYAVLEPEANAAIDHFKANGDQQLTVTLAARDVRAVLGALGNHAVELGFMVSLALQAPEQAEEVFGGADMEVVSDLLCAELDAAANVCAAFRAAAQPVPDTVPDWMTP